ncbi:MAG: efflux RND transporter periplasmic adaptor subunit [Ferruginibacter sp.]
MKLTSRLFVFAFFSLTAASCGNSKKDVNATITEKKTSIAKLKAQQGKTDAEIKKLEEELAAIDTASGNSKKVTLVGIKPVGTQDFQHYIDLQGKIDAENISYVSPRGMGGQVRALYIKAGDYVKKGQLVLRLDDAIARQSVTAARQSLEVLRTQISYAKNIYQRQKNLWDQGIGSEVQLLTAKNNVESLEKQLRSAQENVQVSVVSANTSNVYADVSGVADVVNIHVGEIFAPGSQQIKIVNTSSLKVVSNVPENYISRMKTGSPVIVSIPDLNLTLNSSLSRISQSVDPTQRGFVAEARVPANASLKPNLSAVMKILDYAATDAIVVPINAVQTDEAGKYVYVMQKTSNGKNIASKKPVNIGQVYGELVEIKTGLAKGELLITEGYQNLYEGQVIGTSTN